MTATDQIFRKVAEISIPRFLIIVEFSASGTEMPERIKLLLREKHETVLRGAGRRKFIYKEGGWRLIFTLSPTNKAVDERYALKNKMQIEDGG